VAMLAASKRVIVITGCDTGFGYLSSIDLAENGYRVVSACLTQDGLARLDQHVTLAVICDVTNEEDIKKLAATVEKLVDEENLCLWALINNAGIAPIGYIDWLPMTVIRKTMEVLQHNVSHLISHFIHAIERSDPFLFLCLRYDYLKSLSLPSPLPLPLSAVNIPREG
jgi:NAD(P)-dependent dehydrogenase (short-subunit alcohol dehydrogenase family)